MKYQVRVGSEFDVFSPDGTSDKQGNVVHVTISNASDKPHPPSGPKWALYGIIAFITFSVAITLPALAYGYATKDFQHLSLLSQLINDLISAAVEIVSRFKK